MMKRELYVLAALLCGVLVNAEYCLPGKTCWPSESAIKALDVTLTGRVVLPSTFPTYFILTRMKNTLVTERPAFVVVPRNVKDVQTAIRFAKKYNIRPTILSSGHSYIGRSTGTDTMMINFSDMKRISSDTKSSTPSITVQPGANWGQVYKEADRVRHLVAGASDRTVAPSGCTLGGCMGPMSRMLGLAADNVLGFTAVTADGRIVTMTTATMGSVEDNSGKVSKEDTSDLFWALRGGGGAFAVVTSITFKLHRPPAGFVHLVCGWQYEVAADFLNHYNTVVGKLPKQWGGKLYLQTPPIGLDRAGVTLSMLHYGAWEAPTLNTIKQLTDFKPDNQYFCRFINYTTFYEYEKTVNEASGFRVLINNRFLTTGDLTTGLTKKLKTWHDVALATKLPTGCTWTHLGGEVKEFSEDSSSVGPDLRKALVSLSCGSAWVDADKDCDAEKFMSAFSRDLHKHGRGSYYNEPGRSQVDFRSEYWGGKYDRLLTIKKKWDPENMFTCDQCVGSSIGEVSAMTCRSPALHGLLGQTIYTFMFAMFATLVGLMGWLQ